MGMVRCCVLPWALRKRHLRRRKDDIENDKSHHRTSLDIDTLNQHLQSENQNKSLTTVSTTTTATTTGGCTSGNNHRSNTTPRSSISSTVIQKRSSNATVLSPTEHEALINNAAATHTSTKEVEKNTTTVCA